MKTCRYGHRDCPYRPHQRTVWFYSGREFHRPNFICHAACVPWPHRTSHPTVVQHYFDTLEDARAYVESREGR